LPLGLGKVFGCLETPSSIKLPESVYEIGDEAFTDLDSLIDLSFESVTVRIGVSAFRGCFKLQNAVFPTSLIIIETMLFSIAVSCIRSRSLPGCNFTTSAVKAFRIPF
jgi:hypothetical protein